MLHSNDFLNGDEEEKKDPQHSSSSMSMVDNKHNIPRGPQRMMLPAACDMLKRVLG